MSNINWGTFALFPETKDLIHDIYIYIYVYYILQINCVTFSLPKKVVLLLDTKQF